MILKPANNNCILITGGTSGLGLKMVLSYLKAGYNVVATGRQQLTLEGYPGEFKFCKVDFGSLAEVAAAAREICSHRSVSLILNNAGILSPPAYTETNDRLESTFQINFLAHLLLDEIILNISDPDLCPVIISVTSPAYRIAVPDMAYIRGSADYNPIRSYAASKLFLAMLCEFLSRGHGEPDLHCFSFNPGTFRSGIYRTQKSWFRSMYHFAAPFMRNPEVVAKALMELSLQEDTENGVIYDIFKRKKTLPDFDRSAKETLRERCYELIAPYLR